MAKRKLQKIEETVDTEEYEELDISRSASNNAYILFNNIPEIPFFIKTIQIPDITLGEVTIPRQNRLDWITPSIKTTITSFTLMFFVSEDYSNYFMLLQWLKALRSSDSIREQMTNATIILLNNAKQPIIRFMLHDCWINTLGSVDFDNQSTDPQDVYMTLYTSEFSWEYLVDPVYNIPKRGSF